MAVTISFTFSDANAQRAIDYFVNTKDYANTKLPGETQAQFAKRMWLEELRRDVERYEHNILTQQAIAGAPSGITAT